MSNALRKKKKAMAPLGYTREEIQGIAVHTKQKMREEDMTSNATYTLTNISYFLLHAKFGYGKKRLERLRQGMNKYI